MSSAPFLVTNDHPRILGFEDVFDIILYPAGESHIIQKKYVDDHMTIQASHCRNFTDLGNIATADRILKHNNAKHIHWYIPYFPFARHDRRIDNQDGLELQVAFDMLRGLDNVVTVDPHSDVLGAQYKYIPQEEVLFKLNYKYQFINHPNDQIFVIPDTGATKKAHNWLGHWGKRYAQAHKHRDIRTGDLTGFSVDYADFGGSPCIIVDDICDGGGTFIGLAKELKNKNAGELTLVVSHGLFTAGYDKLREYFDKIYTTGPYNDKVDGCLPHHELFHARYV